MVATDWDGDGNTTEGVKGEIDTLAEALYAQIQEYAEGHGRHGHRIRCSDLSVLHRWMPISDGKTDKDEQGRQLFATMPGRRACSRPPSTISTAQKDPGAFVHNPQYVIQFLIDSIGDLGGNVSGYTRPEVPAQ